MAKKKNTDIEQQDVQNAAPEAQSAAGNAKQYRYIYARKSVERRIRRRRVALVLLIFVLVATLLAGATYAVLSFVDYNSFRVSITQGKAVLSLSNDEAFSKPTTQLSTGKAKNMFDTTYNSLPMLKFRNVDGSYEGDLDYFGSSFYLRNSSTEEVNYNLRVQITNATNDLEKCLRILVIREPLVRNADGEWELLSATANDYSNMEYIVYAYERTKPTEDGETREQVAYDIDRDGEPMLPVYNPNPGAEKNEIWMCTNFVSVRSGNVVDNEYRTMIPGQKVRYTVAIWIEGSDPDTTNERLGGTVTMVVSFNTVGAGEMEVEEQEIGG